MKTTRPQAGTVPSADRPVLADRVRAALAGVPSTREVAMFGGLSFLVDDNIVVAVRRDGDLLVRVDPARRGELLARPGASAAQMGARAMGPGWISVAPDAVATDEQLSGWITLAMEHHAAAG